MNQFPFLPVSLGLALLSALLGEVAFATAAVNAPCPPEVRFSVPVVEHGKAPETAVFVAAPLSPPTEFPNHWSCRYQRSVVPVQLKAARPKGVALGLGTQVAAMLNLPLPDPNASFVEVWEVKTAPVQLVRKLKCPKFLKMKNANPSSVKLLYEEVALSLHETELAEALGKSPAPAEVICPYYAGAPGPVTWSLEVLKR